MRKTWLLAGVVVLAGLDARAGAAQTAEELSVRALRFYRADAGETLVTGLIDIPHQLLRPEGRTVAGQVAVSVSDSNGLELYRAGWPIQAVGARPDANAAVLEVVEFRVKPGRYQMGVEVRDSAGASRASRTVPIGAFSAPPPASDLVLTPSLRMAEAGDTALAPGERRWGGLIYTPVARLHLTPMRARAFYLVEVYGGGDTAVAMSARVLDTAGQALLATPARPVAVGPGGALLRGQLDLTGLPEGEYRLAVRLERGGQVEEREDRFVMADFELSMKREEARLAALRVSDAGYFGLMNESQLDEARAPLGYLVGPDSLAVWNSGLSLPGKRQFLTRFWQQRDPSPGTVRNESREAFYARIEDANQRYGESGRARTPGWRTDRGRIAITHGEAGDVLDRRVASGKAPPYQVWRYTGGRERFYIFVDRTGFGVYKLIASNDIRETSQPGYRDILGGEALQDISRWLGIDLFRNDQGVGARTGQ